MIEVLQVSAKLSSYFEQHLTAINSGIEPAKINALWQDIAKCYSEPTRVYHTLEHLQQLFTQFEQIKDRLQQPSIIALALFYHDVIYDPTRSDNELKSAEYALELLSKYLSSEQSERIYNLIMMTADHQLNDVDSDDKEASDTAYLLDMDLSILGAPWPDYEQYAKAVRQEYSHVTVADYRAGRTKVLQGLLAHPKLYLTNYYQRLESQARQNIEREITLLAT